MSDVAAELAPFEPFLADPVARDITHRTLAWVREHGVFEGDRLANSARLVVVASIYARLCAPAAATRRHYEVAAIFTLLFFYVDDAPASELPELLRGGEPWSVGRLTPSLRAFLADFREREACSPVLRDDLDRSYHAYLSARRAELGHKARPLSVEEHWAFRRKTIFMDPYIDHWMILLGIDPAELDLPAFAAARRISTDIVLLSNDLGSVDRDRPGGESPDDLNLVDAYVLERGLARGETVESLIGLHNEMVDRLRAALEAAIDARRTTSAERYADLLTGITDGNLGSLKALKFRYTGIAATLRRLATVA